MDVLYGALTMRTRIPTFLCSALVLGFLASAASAADPTVLSVRDSAEATVTPDCLVVTLRAEVRGTDAAAIQEEVNRQIAAAVAKAKGRQDVSVATGGFSIYREAGKAGEPSPNLVASQPVILTARSRFTGVLEIAGNLQQSGLLMAGMTFYVSDDLRHQVSDRLIADAVGRVRAQAQIAAGAMGMEVTGYKSLRIDNAAERPIRPRAMAMAVVPGSPTAEPSEQTIGVTAEAEVLLSAKN